MKPAAELIIEIDDLVRKIFIHIDDPETITQTLLALSIKNVGLGNLLVEALELEREAETQYKYQVSKRKLEIMKTEKDDKGKSVSATYAEDKAKIEHKEILDELNHLKGRVDILKVKRSDVSSVIDTGRTRASLIKNDIRNS